MSRQPGGTRGQPEARARPSRMVPEGVGEAEAEGASEEHEAVPEEADDDAPQSDPYMGFDPGDFEQAEGDALPALPGLPDSDESASDADPMREPESQEDVEAIERSSAQT